MSIRKKVASGLLAACAGVVVLASSSAAPAQAWLSQGPIVRYPSSGGTWEYGAWNAHVRSYYTVGKSHGSSVTLDGETVRSICTGRNHRSVAEKFALNWWGADDAYYYRLC